MYIQSLYLYEKGKSHPFFREPSIVHIKLEGITFNMRIYIIYNVYMYVYRENR